MAVIGTTRTKFRTRRAIASAGIAAFLLPFTIHAQEAPAWTRIAGTSFAAGLASPATGPVSSVWFAPNGRSLFARTGSGRIFETIDAEHWRLNTTDGLLESASNTARSQPAAQLPEPGATVYPAGNRIYAAGKSNLYASEDNGRTWLNLTGFNNRSVIGGGFSSFAVSPANPQEIIAANDFGVWRSLDGGLSWHGLNHNLPNLAVRKLNGSRAAFLADGSALTLEGGVWTPSAGQDPELLLRARVAMQARRQFPGAPPTAAAQSGVHVYAGTQDGRIVASHDNGGTWLESLRPVTPGAVHRIWIDAGRPESALALAGDRILRTVNGGTFWDDVTGDLPPAAIHGITADRSASVLYIATDRGVFTGTLSLDAAGPSAANWRSISRDLPVSPAWDVRLNPDNTLSVAIDGYGVYETPAPHRPRTLRLLNGADMSERAAAPGSLVAVQGADVRSGQLAGRPWAVVGSSERSSQLQVPFESAAGTYQVQLDGPAGHWTAPLTVKAASPAIFVDSDGSPLLLDAASGLVLDTTAGIHASSTVQLLATGLGQVTPEWPTGVPAPYDAPPVVRGTITAFLDGTPVEVTRATLAPGYVGYYIVELRIPAIINRGASELRLLMNGEESNRVRLYLEPDLAAQ